MKELLAVVVIILAFAVGQLPVAEMLGFHSTAFAQETTPPKKVDSKSKKASAKKGAKKKKQKKGASGVSPDTPKKDGGK